VSLIEAELDRTDAERLDEFERRLIEQGLDPAEAAKVRAEVEDQLDTDPAMSFHDATVAGLAEYSGMSVDEWERGQRAFELYPADVAVIVDQHFDTLAGRTGNREQITVEDLHDAIADESLPDEVRDAAYRLAADGVLFTDMDVAKQTDLSDEPLAAGFRWNEADGIIGRDDVAQYPAKAYQSRILLAWHPLIETANQGYDFGRADSHAGQDDVIAFIGDRDIPVYVRLAVFDVYAERHQLTLDRRQELEQELALDSTGVHVGGTAVLEASAPPARGSGPVVAPARTGPGGGARGGGTGGGSGTAVVAAIVAQLIVVGVESGFDELGRRGIEAAGDPRFVHVDPLTGRRVAADPAELEGLSPAEAKAWAAHFSATGRPPSSIGDTIEPHPYLDVNGQWRMSDTNEPVHDADQIGEPPELIVAPPPGVYVDVNGEWRYEADGEIYDGFELSPTERKERFEWGNPSGRSGGFSSRTFGHTFTRHGRRLKLTQLQDRARVKNTQIGQFLDDDAAAAFLAEHYDPAATAPYLVPIPAGLAARVVYPDGTVNTNPTHVRIVPHGDPDIAIESAYPIVQE
ncbi:MAG: hypothetical protein ACR2QK_25285, partial [Acidimicrobiales bacterium]